MRLPLGILLVLAFLSACSRKPVSQSQQEPKEKRQTAKDSSAQLMPPPFQGPDSLATVLAIKGFLANPNGSLPHNAKPDTMLTQFYSGRNFAPLWSLGKWKEWSGQLVDSIAFDGLMPQHYRAAEIDSGFKQLTIAQDTSSKNWAALELAATTYYLEYIKDLYFGKVNPAEVFPSWNYQHRPIPSHWLDSLNGLMETFPLWAIAKLARPKMHLYEQFRNELIRLHNLEGHPNFFAPIPDSTPVLKVGMQHPSISIIKDHLTFLGYEVESTGDDYDSLLLASVRLFQKHSGSKPDGVIGKGTIKALNISYDDLRAKLKVNMERVRWLNSDLPDYYIMVNIAAFRLFVINQGRVEYHCRVVVGKQSSQTPVFSDNMTYIEVNPTWTVPRSIAVKEVLPILKKNPNYLNTHNMELLKGDVVVDPLTIDFNKYSVNNFPFVIRQKPGENNALGRMKFIFPNPYNVYLHDTPSKSYFEQDVRAFSHGCIRVDQPSILAYTLLKKQGKTAAEFDAMLERGKTDRIHFKYQVPVFLTYWTAYFGKDGLYFLPDIYQRDSKVLAYLLRE